MSKLKKLYERVLNNPQDVRFSDICKLSELFGFSFKGGKGSHRAYTREGIDVILNFQNVNGKAKPYQVRQLLNIVADFNLEINEEADNALSNKGILQRRR